MSSRILVNLGLLVLLAGLILVVIYEPGKKPPATPNLLTGLDKKDISRITIGDNSGIKVAMKKHDGEWRVEQPVTMKADSGRIDSLLGIAAATSHAGFSVTDEQLAKYTLDPPRAWIELDDLRISFGGTEPVNHRRYVHTNNKVHLITDVFYHYLVSRPMSWCSSELLPAGDAPVMFRTPSFTLEQQPDGAWHSSTAMPGLTADTLNSFVDRWRHARALKVSLADKPQDGQPIEILLNSGTRIEFTLLQNEEEMILVREDLGAQYHLTSETGARLLKLPMPADQGGGEPAADH